MLLRLKNELILFLSIFDYLLTPLYQVAGFLKEHVFNDQVWSSVLVEFCLDVHEVFLSVLVNLLLYTLLKLRVVM